MLEEAKGDPELNRGPRARRQRTALEMIIKVSRHDPKDKDESEGLLLAALFLLLMAHPDNQINVFCPIIAYNFFPQIPTKNIMFHAS